MHANGAQTSVQMLHLKCSFWPHLNLQDHDKYSAVRVLLLAASPRLGAFQKSVSYSKIDANVSKSNFNSGLSSKTADFIMSTSRAQPIDSQFTLVMFLGLVSPNRWHVKTETLCKAHYKCLADSEFKRRIYQK